MLLYKIKSLFNKGSPARDVVVLTIGTALAQGLTIAATPLLSRLYTPEDFGLLAIFLAISGVAATLVTGRYETSILVPQKETEAADLVFLSLFLTGIGSIFFSTLSIFLPIEYQEHLGLKKLIGWLPLTFVAGGLMAITNIAQGWLNREKKYPQMANLRVLQSVGIVISAVLFGLLPDIGQGLLLAQMLACAITGICALWFARSVARYWQIKKILQAARTHKNAPKYLLPTALLDALSLQIPIFTITIAYGAGDAGKYSLAMRFLALPAALIGNAIGQVFFQKAAIFIHENRQGLLELYTKITISLFIATIPVLTIIAMEGQTIFGLFLGEKWQEAGSMAELLIFSSSLYFIFSPTSNFFILLKKERILLGFSFFQLIYRITAFATSENTLTYIKNLVFFECINVLFIEITLIYLIISKKQKK